VVPPEKDSRRKLRMTIKNILLPKKGNFV